MKSHEVRWSPWSPTKVCEIPRSPTKSGAVPRSPRNPIKSHEVPWSLAKSHEVLRSLTKSVEVFKSGVRDFLLCFTPRMMRRFDGISSMFYNRALNNCSSVPLPRGYVITGRYVVQRSWTPSEIAAKNSKPEGPVVLVGLDLGRALLPRVILAATWCEPRTWFKDQS